VSARAGRRPGGGHVREGGGQGQPGGQLPAGRLPRQVSDQVGWPPLERRNKRVIRTLYISDAPKNAEKHIMSNTELN